MLKSLLKYLKYILVLGILIIGLLVFIPRTYDVGGFKAIKGVKYWELSTGSKIGYHFLNGKGHSILPPIIYLHGGPGGRIHQSHISFLQTFANQGYDVYLYDQIGSGHSERLENIQDYSVDRHKQDLAEIIQTIGAEKVILYGHSWGSLLATEFYSEFPDKIDRMIFSGPGPILPINQSLRGNVPPDSLNLIQPKFSNRQGFEKANNIRNKAVFYWAKFFGTKLASDEEGDQFQTSLCRELSKSTTCDGSNPGDYEHGDGYYSQIMTVMSFGAVKDKRDKIKGSSTPLLILKGQCDNQSWGYTQEYLDLFSNSELHIIENSGHKIEDKDKEEYLKIIEEFLTRDL